MTITPANIEKLKLHQRSTPMGDRAVEQKSSSREGTTKIPRKLREPKRKKRWQCSMIWLPLRL